MSISENGKDLPEKSKETINVEPSNRVRDLSLSFHNATLFLHYAVGLVQPQEKSELGEEVRCSEAAGAKPCQETPQARSRGSHLTKKMRSQIQAASYVHFLHLSVSYIRTMLKSRIAADWNATAKCRIPACHL